MSNKLSMTRTEMLLRIDELESHEAEWLKANDLLRARLKAAERDAARLLPPRCSNCGEYMHRSDGCGFSHAELHLEWLLRLDAALAGAKEAK
jgi:hypothetical protein